MHTHIQTHIQTHIHMQTHMMRRFVHVHAHAHACVCTRIGNARAHLEAREHAVAVGVDQPEGRAHL